MDRPLYSCTHDVSESSENYLESKAPVIMKTDGPIFSVIYMIE